MIYTVTISLLIEKLFYLLRPQSVSFQIASEFIDTFIDTLCPKGGAFDSLFVPRGGFMYTMIVPREGSLLPSSRVPGGGG